MTKQRWLYLERETSGVFQFESAGIRNVLRKLGPSIEDIAAVNALYRPGPMQNIDVFIRRKKGLEQISYPEPSLAPFWKIRTELLFTKSRLCKLLRKWQASL